MTETQPQRHILSNGLRVLCRPLRTAGVVAVAVHYGVGFRSEPVERAGFAHLFEHLMFQDSATVEPGGHFATVQACGGAANAATLQDHTEFYQVVPVESLDRVLLLEADRMAGPRLCVETLRTQTLVVKEEIRQNVLGRAFGGFPWTRLPSVLYTRYENAHNGYGTLVDIDAVQLGELNDFFRKYYTPGNAVVTICGDVDPDRALALAERRFGEIPARTQPPAPELHEPPAAQPRRLVQDDPHARLGATALGYRLPDAAADLTGYLAHHVLGRLLTGGQGSGLRRRLVEDGRLATDISMGCGFFGPLRARDPDTFVVAAVHAAHADATTAECGIRAAVDDELRLLAERGPGAAEMAQARALSVTAAWQALDDLVGMTRSLGGHEILFGRAELTEQVAATLSGLSAADVVGAAEALVAAQPAVLAVRPAAASQARTVRPALVRTDVSGSPASGAARPFPVVSSAPPAGPLGPPVVETTLASGARLIASRLPSTPMAEIRVVVRLTPATRVEGACHEILAATLLHGTPGWGHDAVVRDFAVRGATLSVARSPRWLIVAGSVRAVDLGDILDKVAKLLAAAGHADSDVESARARVRQQAVLARQDPRSMIGEALVRRLYGDVPGLEAVPADDALARITGEMVRDGHHRAVVPERATVVVVGDVDLDRVAGLVDGALSAWTRAGAAPPPPATRLRMPLSGLHWMARPGAVQSRIRLVRPALERADPDYAALTLANIVFGGGFASRLTTTLRETDGLAYRCNSTFDDHLDQVVVTVEVETATDATDRTLGRLRSLMGDMADAPPTPSEIESARRYAVGMLRIGMSSQRSWAANLVTSTCLGQHPSAIRAFPDQVRTAQVSDVHRLAKEYYDPDSYRGVVLTAPEACETPSASTSWKV